ncbi:MAG: glutamate 5-kinase [Candidatus Aureabacteria bacterium]|nr:glutamate 5-kinase [Candidatus Auribacterota bacterium]
MKTTSTGAPVDRPALLRPVRRVVVKVGTYLLTGKGTPLNLEMMRKIASEIAELKRRGKEVVLVTSGAIGAGVLELKLKERPKDLPGLQAAAAVGQAGLMHLYRACFAAHGLTVGQILLTREDVRARARHLNVRHTIAALLKSGAVPIINENDSVAVDEIEFGDNDYLAALVAILIQAELLILLTDVEGLLAPAGTEGQEKRVAKLEAAGIATRGGGMVVIASGRRPAVLVEVIEGRETGTLFLPTARRVGGRKCWIAFSCVRKGQIVVDDGARRALVARGKSLLASGVIRAQGDFAAGDMVEIAGPEGTEFARGLTNYGADDLRKIQGKKSAQIASLLGQRYYDEVVHRDNLLIL